MDPLTLSVVVPTYNRAHLLGRAIASVLREIGPGDEVLVVNDGSTDNTEELVKGFADTRVRYFRQANAGPGAARNRGVAEATGDLLAFLDSDDEWLPGKTLPQRNFMAARPDVLCSFTDIADHSGRRRTLASWQADQHGWREAMGAPMKYSSFADPPEGIPDFDVYSGDVYRMEMHASYFFCDTMMVRRSVAGDQVRFTEGIATWEDWECFGRLARLGPFVYLDYLGAIQHSHSGPRVTDANWVRGPQSRLVVLQNVWGADPAFLAEFGEEYHALVRQQRLYRVRQLLREGRTLEARQEVRTLSGVPVLYRVLSRLPGNLVESVAKLRSVAAASATRMTDSL
jgi:GT2 family glycosyltransferase